MKKMFKKFVSILLVLCVMVTTAVVALPTAHANPVAALGSFAKSKALQLGIRFACGAAIEQAALAEDDDASLAVQSFINYIICDGTSASVNEIKGMCKQILADMANLKSDVKDYTAMISSAIYNSDFRTEKGIYYDKWAEDVTNVINPKGSNEVSVNDAYNAYLKYYIASSLNSNGMPEDKTQRQQIETFWEEKFKEEFTEDKYSMSMVLSYKQALEDEFLKIQTIKPINDDNRESSRESVYNSAYVYLQFIKVIDELVDNYLADEAGTNGKVYTVTDCAATDAYYALPFAFQQREFIEAAAKEQIMTVTFMELCLNEYLAFQGSYLLNHLDDGWNTQDILTYIDNSGDESRMNYAECVSLYKDTIERDLEKAVALMESEYKINTTAYTGSHEDIKLSLNDFMEVEDAQRVAISISDFEKIHSYYKDTEGTEVYNPSWWYYKNENQSPQNIPDTLYFYRVMSGDASGTVYYILDPMQFGDSLDIKTLGTNVRRIPNAGYDAYIGDFYPVSVDYLNLIKTMSDGTNKFHVPASGAMTKELSALINVPCFSASSENYLKSFLGAYLPASSKTPYILTSTYDNHFDTGYDIDVKKAGVNLVSVEEMVDNKQIVSSSEITIEDAPAGKGYYTVILANNSNTFYQKASLKVNDNFSAVSKAEIAYSGGKVVAGQSATIESGSEVKIHFDIDNFTNFESLKLVRKNAEQTETVLINGYEELVLFADKDGKGYTYEMAMPYSEAEFVITTKDSDNLAYLTLNDPYSNANTFEIVDFAQDTLIEAGDFAAIEAGEKVTFKVSLKHPDTFKSIVAITEGKEKTIIEASTFKANYDSHSLFQYITTTMPEGDTEFVLNTSNVALNRAYAKAEDPAEVVSSINIHGKYTNTYLNSFERFRNGEELTISFSLKNSAKFESLVAVNTETREITTLVNSEEISELSIENGYYTYKTQMPSYNVEYVVVTKQSEEFVPVLLEKNEEGSFIIRDYEDLRSMAYFVNTGMDNYVNGNYTLANDIDVLNRELEPIASVNDNSVVFSGTFDGQGHTISNFKILSSMRSGEASLFGRISGEVKNLKLCGDYTAFNDGVYSVAYVSGLAKKLHEGAKITNVETNLNYKVEGFKTVVSVTGIAYQADNNVTIENCIVNDTVNLPQYNADYSGFVYNSGSNTTVNFKNCANTSIVNTGEGKYCAGIMYGATWVNINIENSYVACDFCGDNLAPFAGAIFANTKVTNSYYLDSCIGEESEFTELGTSKTIDDFASGEVSYLLNKSVTDGTQTWYQNLDDGEETDIYPCFDGKTVYAVSASGEETYSNFVS